jgi:hypothetical protein
MASSGQLYLAWQAHQMNDRGQAEIERQREAETGLGLRNTAKYLPSNYLAVMDSLYIFIVLSTPVCFINI